MMASVNGSHICPSWQLAIPAGTVKQAFSSKTLLNACLTVPAGMANGHAGQIWEPFTDAIIRVVNQQEQPVVFILWGAYARKKKALITASQHLVIESAHPSPLSAYRGFFGSRPFSRANAFLEAQGQTPINWLS